jgi:hypothetical protein
MKTNPQNWFKYSGAEAMLVKKKRKAYEEQCPHFDSSGIGIVGSEKKILTAFKKNCGFCKVEKKQKLDVPEKEAGGSGCICC